MSAKSESKEKGRTVSHVGSLIMYMRSLYFSPISPPTNPLDHSVTLDCGSEARYVIDMFVTGFLYAQLVIPLRLESDRFLLNLWIADDMVRLRAEFLWRNSCQA